MPSTCYLLALASILTLIFASAPTSTLVGQESEHRFLEEPPIPVPNGVQWSRVDSSSELAALRSADTHVHIVVYPQFDAKHLACADGAACILLDFLRSGPREIGRELPALPKLRSLHVVGAGALVLEKLLRGASTTWTIEELVIDERADMGVALMGVLKSASALPRLRHLKLLGNGCFSGNIDSLAALSNAPVIESLCLGAKVFRFSQLASLRSFAALRRLEIYWADSQPLGVNDVRHILNTRISDVTLGDVGVTPEGLSMLARAGSIKALSVSVAPSTLRNVEDGKGLVSVRFTSRGCGALVHEDAVALASLSSVESLALVGWELRPGFVSAFAIGKRLRQIVIEDCSGVTAGLLGTITPHKTVEHLSLAMCVGVGDGEIAALKGARISHLSLSGLVLVTPLSIATLASIEGLLAIDVSGCDKDLVKGVIDMRLERPLLKVSR